MISSLDYSTFPNPSSFLSPSQLIPTTQLLNKWRHFRLRPPPRHLSVVVTGEYTHFDPLPNSRGSRSQSASSWSPSLIWTVHVSDAFHAPIEDHTPPLPPQGWVSFRHLFKHHRAQSLLGEDLPDALYLPPFIYKPNS